MMHHQLNKLTNLTPDPPHYLRDSVNRLPNLKGSRLKYGQARSRGLPSILSNLTRDPLANIHPKGRSRLKFHKPIGLMSSAPDPDRRVNVSRKRTVLHLQTIAGAEVILSAPQLSSFKYSDIL